MLYRIECADALSDQIDWQTLADWYPSHGTNTFILDTGDYFRTPYIVHPRNASTRFYRIMNEGTNTAPSPNISITSPSSGSSLSGNLTVSVCRTDQATLNTTLYVDGEAMPRAATSRKLLERGHKLPG